MPEPTTTPAELRRLYAVATGYGATLPDRPHNVTVARLDLLASIPALADQLERDAARIEELEGALRFIRNVTGTSTEAHHAADAALAQPRVDGPTETEVSDG